MFANIYQSSFEYHWNSEKVQKFKKSPTVQCTQVFKEMVASIMTKKIINLFPGMP
jgi:hypothetical protein